MINPVHTGQDGRSDSDGHPGPGARGFCISLPQCVPEGGEHLPLDLCQQTILQLC